MKNAATIVRRASVLPMIQVGKKKKKKWVKPLQAGREARTHAGRQTDRQAGKADTYVTTWGNY